MPKPYFTDSEFVSVRAFAPFEVRDVMAEWSRRYKADQDRDEADRDIRSKIAVNEKFFVERRDARAGGLGAPFKTHDETPEHFGLRVAAALFTLIKEV